MAEQSGSKERKKVFCDVCSTFVSSESLLIVHNNGKKHQRLLKARAEKQACAERSVYVRGFCDTGALENDLSIYFSSFGDVSSIFVDKEKAKYAIVEFECPTNAQALLASKDLPLFHGKSLIVKRRSFKEPPAKKPKQTSSFNRERMVSHAVKVNSFLEEDVIYRIKKAQTLNEQITVLALAKCLTNDEAKLRKLIVQYLQEIFVEVFPGCEVVPFGSSATGLSLKGADLDLCLLTDPELFKNVEVEENEDYSPSDAVSDQLQFIVKVLREFAAGFRNVVPIVSAKCPVVKFLHRDSELACDLSINNRLALRNTELITNYVALDNRILPLAITLKTWGKAKHLSGSGGRQISNYALVLMLVHYLQRTLPRVLPVLQNTPEVKTFSKGTRVDKETVIEGWDCSFTLATEVEESQNKESVGDLLKGWFHYYGQTFDYENEVVTIQHDKSSRVLKHSVTKDIAQTAGQPDLFKISSLCVQDPFELSHNLTHVVSDSILKRFVECCMEAHSALSEIPNEISGNEELFLKLFTVPSDLSAYPKKKVYSFFCPLTLATTKHEENEVAVDQLLGTFRFISNILTNDLQVSWELKSNECVGDHEISLDRADVEPACADERDSVQKDLSQSSRKRPREEPRTEMLDVKKKCDQRENKHYLLHCKASDLSWQNRRRKRRLRKHSKDTAYSGEDNTRQSSTSEPCPAYRQEGVVPTQKKCGTDEITQHADTLFRHASCSSTSQKEADPISRQPLIEFTLKIELVNDKQRGPNECNVVLSYVNGSIHHFANFYAFLKKHVTMKIAECGL